MTESALWGLFGTIVGAAASIGTTFLASRNAAKLQIAAANLEQLNRHQEFQRETLVDLQDALHNELRAISLVYQADEVAFSNTGSWGTSLLGENLNNSAHEAGRRILILAARVADDKLREKLKIIRRIATEILLARDKAIATDAMNRLASEGLSTMDDIGDVLRALYPTKDT
jgi:hypothetical protein